jgi:protein-S-isoprenylcysteine O-methyltransferase Ste14
MDNLKKRSLIGFIIMIVIMGLLLFVPAGTIYFWQAWSYLGLFAISTIIITVYFLKKDPKLIERRLNVGPIAEKEKSQKIIQVVTSVLFCAIFIISGFEHRFHWSYVPEHLTIIADFFIVLGFLIMFLSFKENSYASSIIEIDKEQKVISTGVYGIVRHPMYAGGVIMFLFTPLALGSLWSLPCVFLMSFMIAVRLTEEENFLSEHLAGYKDYCQKVRCRMMPMIW